MSDVIYSLTKREAGGKRTWHASFRTYGMAWDYAIHMFQTLNADVVGCHMDRDMAHCGEFFVVVDKQTEIWDIHEDRVIPQPNERSEYKSNPINIGRY